MTNIIDPTPRIPQKSRLIGVVAGVVGAVIAFFAVQSMFKGPSSTARELESAFDVTRYGALIRDEFSEEYQDMIRKLTAYVDSAGATQSGADELARKMTAGVRTKYADYARLAPDGSLRRVIESQISLLEAVRTKYGVGVCAGFANTGVTALGQARVDLYEVANELDLAAAAMMQTIADGRRTPGQTSVARQTDFDPSFPPALLAGKSEFDLGVLQDGRVSDGDCQATLTYLQDSLGISDSPGMRARAYIVNALAHGR